MPVTIPAAAFSVMFTDAVSLTAYSRASGETRSATRSIAAASVSAPSTDPLAVGGAEGAWKWTVEFPASAWDADIPPAPGSEIAAGERWPALYVQEAFPLGGVWHLVCSSRELPQ